MKLATLLSRVAFKRQEVVVKRAILVLAFTSMSMIGCAGGVVYYANTPPPPVRVEAFGPAPGPGYVWVGGYWGWRGGNYTWIGGNWARPPRAHAVWVAPRWESYRGRYRFYEGRWR
jgi:hypothetical protein